jgi:anti-anti-sigma regulatory factor
MTSASPRERSVEALQEAFCARLAGAMPFREDSALVPELAAEVRPVLEALLRGHGTAQHEGFALLRLLSRRAALLGATPTAALALARAIEGALLDQGVERSNQEREHLEIVVVEGYSAGRDELREEKLRRVAADTQVWFALAPRCYVICLAGSHHPEQLEQSLDAIARALFRADARALVLDLSRLLADDEDSARSLVSFVHTLRGLGADVLLCGADPALAVWFENLRLAQSGVERCDSFGAAQARALALCGYELRPRGRLGDLMERVRSPR